MHDYDNKRVYVKGTESMHLVIPLSSWELFSPGGVYSSKAKGSVKKNEANGRRNFDTADTMPPWLEQQ